MRSPDLEPPNALEEVVALPAPSARAMLSAPSLLTTLFLKRQSAGQPVGLAP